MNEEKRPILVCTSLIRQYPAVPECTEFGKQHRDGRYEVLGYFLPQEEFNAYVAEAEKLINELYDKIDELKKGNGEHGNE